MWLRNSEKKKKNEHKPNDAQYFQHSDEDNKYGENDVLQKLESCF